MTQEKKTQAVIKIKSKFAGQDHFKEDEEELDVRLFETEPAVIGYSGGQTVNLGNFESIRIDVNLRLPCYVEEIDSAYRWAQDWVGARIEEEIEKVKPKPKDLF